MSASQDQITKYWDQRATSYADFQNERAANVAYRSFWAGLWSAAIPGAGRTVLDVGTGTGAVAHTLAGLGHEVTGTDLSAQMLDRARASAAPDATVRFEIGNAMAPQCADESLDAITNRYVMWTLADPEGALRNWLRILRPGGRLAIIDATWFDEGVESSGADERFSNHYNDRVRSDLPLMMATDIAPTVRAVEASGFVDVQTHPLVALRQLDQTYGVAENHVPRLQYLITGVRPH